MAKAKLPPDIYQQMIAALPTRYSDHYSNVMSRTDWVIIEELRVGTGAGHNNEQRIDVFIISQNIKHVKIVLEIKISRSDFLHEIKQPLKRRSGLRLSNLFYFYVPKGLVKPEEIPPECGLLEFDPNGKESWGQRRLIHETLAAPWRDSLPPSWSFFVSAIRNLEKKYEQQLRDKQVEALEALRKHEGLDDDTEHHIDMPG